jgi:hypothetical protein
MHFVTKYFCVYPYSFRIFMSENCSCSDNYFINNMSVAQQTFLFKNIKAKYLSANYGMVDPFTYRSIAYTE